MKKGRAMASLSSHCSGRYSKSTIIDVSRKRAEEKSSNRPTHSCRQKQVSWEEKPTHFNTTSGNLFLPFADVGFWL